MKNLIIRKATPEDLEIILVLSDELTLSDLPYDKEVIVDWPHTPKGKQYYEEKINQTKGVCFVAEDEGKVIGYFTASEEEVPSYRLIKVAELENLVVSEKYRGLGVGKELMAQFIVWAKEIGAQKISVNVFTGNKKGIAFYEREGFLPFETILEKPLT